MNAWKVKRTGGRRTETVYATYFKVVDGVAFFRCWPRDRDQYPVLVKCYAAGSWHSIEPAVPPFRKDKP